MTNDMRRNEGHKVRNDQGHQGLWEIPHVPAADSFDFGNSWNRIKQSCSTHRYLILLTCVLTVALVVLYIRVWPPVYTSEVMLVADAQQDSQRDNFYQYWNVFRKDPLPDEVPLISSGPVLKKVVLDLGLTYDEVYHPFFSHLTYLWTSSWVGKKYRKVKEWFFPPKKTKYDPSPQEIEMGRTVQDFSKGVKLEPVPETNVGRLVVKGPSVRVAEVANAVVDTYLVQRRQRHIDEAEEACEGLALETKKAEQDLIKLEAKMQEYYDKNSILMQFEKDKVELSKYIELEASNLETEALVASLYNSIKEVDSQMAAEQKEIVASRVYQRNTVKDMLKDRLLQLELAMKQTTQRFQPDSPEVVELRDQITSVRAMMDREAEDNEFQSTKVLNSTYETLRLNRNRLESELAGSKASLESKRKAEAYWKKLVSTIPEKLRREHIILEKRYMTLEEKLMMAEVSKATAKISFPSLRIVDRATTSDKPTWPNTKLLISIAVLVGLCAGAALALLLDTLNGRVTRYKAELDVYAVLDRLKSTSGRNTLFDPEG